MSKIYIPIISKAKTISIQGSERRLDRLVCRNLILVNLVYEVFLNCNRGTNLKNTQKLSSNETQKKKFTKRTNNDA